MTKAYQIAYESFGMFAMDQPPADRRTYRSTAMEAINAHKDEPFLALEREVRKAVKERAMYKIKLFGDDGRADE